MSPPAPGRPRRRRVRLPAGPGRSSHPHWRAIAVGGSAIVALVVVIALAAAPDVRSSPAAPARPEGATDRTSFLLVPSGRSQAEVRDILGPPRSTRAGGGAARGSECWWYASRSGRPLTYQLCFSGGFLSGKSVLPYAVDRIPTQ